MSWRTTAQPAERSQHKCKEHPVTSAGCSFVMALVRDAYSIFRMANGLRSYICVPTEAQPAISPIPLRIHEGVAVQTL